MAERCSESPAVLTMRWEGFRDAPYGMVLSPAAGAAFSPRYDLAIALAKVLCGPKILCGAKTLAEIVHAGPAPDAS